MLLRRERTITRYDYGGLIFLFDEDKEGVVREGLRECTYLTMLMKLWNGYLENQ